MICLLRRATLSSRVQLIQHLNSTHNHIPKSEADSLLRSWPISHRALAIHDNVLPPTWHSRLSGVIYQKTNSRNGSEICPWLFPARPARLSVLFYTITLHHHNMLMMPHPALLPFSVNIRNCTHGYLRLVSYERRRRRSCVGCSCHICGSTYVVSLMQMLRPGIGVSKR